MRPTVADDWKGEHLIRARKPTKDERRSFGMSAVSSLTHEKRRRAGIPANGDAQHKRFVKSIFIDLSKYRDGGDL